MSSNDGDHLGTIEDFYFEDERWTVRYIVVRAGSWLTGRAALLSPMAIARVLPEGARLEFRLTRAQIRAAPAVDLARPVSRPGEATHAAEYGFPLCGLRTGLGCAGAVPRESHAGLQTPATEDQYLRSAKEVAGYHIHARDGEIGHLEDYLVADDTWTIRYLIVDTSNWIDGRSVLIAHESAHRIDWAHRQMHIGVTRQDCEGES